MRIIAGFSNDELDWAGKDNPMNTQKNFDTPLLAWALEFSLPWPDYRRLF